MRNKRFLRIIPLLLCIALTVTASGGAFCIESFAAKSSSSSKKIPEETAVLRDMGLLPADWTGNYGKSVGFNEFFTLIEKTVERCDKKALPKFQKLIDKSKAPSHDVMRDDAMIICFLAVEALDDLHDFATLELSNNERIDPKKNTPKGSYPYCRELNRNIKIHNIYSDETYSIYGVQNAALRMTTDHIDLAQQKHYLDYDKNYNYNLDKKLTRETAASCAVRLYNSVALRIRPTKVQSQKVTYKPISKVGSYNKKIITDEIRKNCTLGNIDKKNVPYWTGYILNTKHVINTDDNPAWKAYTPGQLCYTEEEIRYLAENGFNCVRALYSFSFLSDPKNVNRINMAELEQLDELLSWCMKYNIHLMISVTGLPGKANTSYGDENVMCNTELYTSKKTRNAFASYWDMLSKRYKDIPNGALSFELAAEPYWTPADNYFSTLAPVARSMFKDRADRIVVINAMGGEVPEKFAAIGCCISLHTHISTTCYLEPGFNPWNLDHEIGYKPYWPMAYLIDEGTNSRGKLTFKAEKSFSKGTIKLHAEVYTLNEPLVIRCDGKKAEVTKTMNGQVTEFTASIPEGTKEITIFDPDGEYYKMSVVMVEIEQSGKKKRQFATHSLWNSIAGDERMPTIQVNDDGTFKNLDGHKVDGEYIYRSYIKPHVDAAEKYGVSFILSEVGTDNVSFSREDFLEYNEMWLKILKEHNIGWLYNFEGKVFYPKQFMDDVRSMPQVFKRYSRWDNTIYYVNDDIMELLKKYR